jgi:hypothetical protein
MQVIRRCNSLPAMRVHAFSTKAVCVLNTLGDLVPVFEKAGFTELLELEFAEWVTKKIIAHFIADTE